MEKEFDSVLLLALTFQHLTTQKKPPSYNKKLKKRKQPPLLLLIYFPFHASHDIFFKKFQLFDFI